MHASFAAIEARLGIMAQQAGTNLEIVLMAIQGLSEKINSRQP